MGKEDWPEIIDRPEERARRHVLATLFELGRDAERASASASLNIDQCEAALHQVAWMGARGYPRAAEDRDFLRQRRAIEEASRRWWREVRRLVLALATADALREPEVVP